MKAPSALRAGLCAGTALLAATLLAPPGAAASVRHPTVVSATPAATTPHLQATEAVPRPAVFAFEQAGRTMYVGGKYTALQDARRRTTYTRQHLAAFDAGTGAISGTFLPRIDGPVWAVRAAGPSLYVAGTFSNVDGEPRRGVAKIDAVTGRLDRSFRATSVNGDVTDLRIAKGRLIVGGQFGKRLAALNLVTGADTGYLDLRIAGSAADNNNPTAVYRFAVTQDEDRLVAIGNMGTVSGQVRARAFMVDLGPTKGTLNPWYYSPLQKTCRTLRLSAYLRDVDFSPDGSWFALVSTGGVPLEGDGGLTVCDAAARFETGVPNPSRPTWINYTGGDTLHSVAVTGAAVYVSGHHRWLDNPRGKDFCGAGCVSRPGIGAIDPATGKALAWNPTKSRAIGGKELLATPDGLWVGSDGTQFARQYHYGIAFAPLP